MAKRKAYEARQGARINGRFVISNGLRDKLYREQATCPPKYPLRVIYQHCPCNTQRYSTLKLYLIALSLLLRPSPTPPSLLCPHSPRVSR
uniref:CCT domain-containing protein n=1 Tax=Heterorhabditis bacteriophora TaxID=37862 RepID=A0A1I7XBW9_HETBA